MSASVDSGPVTISIERRVVKGRESEFEAWVSGITVEALKFQGHMGVNVIRPGSGSSNYVTIFRFDDYEHSKTWEGSDVRREWLDKLGDIIEGDAKIMKGTGLEFWFDLPELPVVRPCPWRIINSSGNG